MPLNTSRERRRHAGDARAAACTSGRATSTQSSVRHRVWQIVEAARPGDVASRRFAVVILALIGMNVVAVVLESVRSIEAAFGSAFAVLEACSVAVFAAEYAARLWTCVEDPRYHGAVRGRMRWALRPLALVDLLAFAPFIATLGTADLRVLRALRLLRLVRLLKVGRYLAALTLLRSVVHAKRAELVMGSALTSVLLIVSSSIMYFAENQAQPDKFSSIPASMWWAICTLTTVGYGDVYPVTVPGRMAGGFLALMGVGLFALPTAILGSGLVEAVQRTRPHHDCPHCGKPVR